MKKLLIANWKTSPDNLRQVGDILSGLFEFVKLSPAVEMVICPSFVFLESAVDKLKSGGAAGAKIKLGAQDIFWEKKGICTGEISVSMLKNLGVKYVIVGHSERRSNFSESDEMINLKIKAVLKSGMKAVLCVGERERDEVGAYLKFVKGQFLNALKGVSRKEIKNLVIAYEPVWAISSSRGACADSPEEVFQMAVYLRKSLFFRFGIKTPKEIPILYGGSVDDKNAANFMKNGGIQGFLVGRSSLNPKIFSAIYSLMNKQ